MALDLGDYVDEVRLQVSPPGVDLYPDSDDDEWVTRLANAFWDGRLQGLTALAGYTCDADGLITPHDTSSPDMPRDLVQLIIVWAAFRAAVNAMVNLKTQFRATAGPVTFEQQQSATVMRDVLAALKDEKNLILERLSDLGLVPTYVFDVIAERDVATLSGATDWVTAGFDQHSRSGGSGHGFGP